MDRDQLVQRISSLRELKDIVQCAFNLFTQSQNGGEAGIIKTGLRISLLEQQMRVVDLLHESVKQLHKCENEQAE